MNALVCLVLLALLGLGGGGVKAQFASVALDSASAHCPYPGIAMQGSKYCPIPNRLVSNVMRSTANNTTLTTSGLPPLAGRIGLGLDPITAQAKLPVVKLTYQNSGKVWTHPTSGANFQVPDQVSLTPVDFSSDAPVMTKAFKNVFEFLDTVYGFVSGNFMNIGGVFNNRAALMDLYNTYFPPFGSLTVSQERREVYRLSISTGVELDPFAKRAIDYLPVNYDYATYAQFIQYWGIYYITEGSLGGMAEQQSAVHNLHVCTGGRLSLDALSREGQYDLKNNQRPGSVPDGSRIGEYKEHLTLNVMSIMGGNPELGSWDQRVNSFPDSPVILSANHRPIAELIADPTKRANFERAVNEYVTAGLNNIHHQKSQLPERVAIPIYKYDCSYGNTQCPFSVISKDANEYGCKNELPCAYKGVLGYCASKQLPGTIPMHRYTCTAEQKANFIFRRPAVTVPYPVYTISPPCQKNFFGRYPEDCLLNDNTCRYDGVYCYIWPVNVKDKGRIHLISGKVEQDRCSLSPSPYTTTTPKTPFFWGAVGSFGALLESSNF